MSMWWRDIARVDGVFGIPPYELALTYLRSKVEIQVVQEGAGRVIGENRSRMSTARRGRTSTMLEEFL